MTANKADEADAPGPIREPRLWCDNGWTARVVKNEDDEGWAVEMILDDDRHALLAAHDAAGEELARVRVSSGFKLNKATASAWIDADFRRPD
jgi:hypothetical protein